MRYGKFISGGMLERDFPADGYKPIVETAPETPDGYRAVSHYEDAGETIVSVWEYIELTDEEKEEIERRGIEDAEAYKIIFGGDAE